MTKTLKTSFAVVFCVATSTAAAVSCPEAKPLGAHLELRLAHTDGSFARDSQIRVWFELQPPPGVDAYVEIFPWSAAEMIWRTSATACRDAPSFGTCSCPASRASGTADLSGGYATYDASGPELRVMFPTEIVDSAEVRLHCVTGSDSFTESGASLALNATFDVRPRGSDDADAIYVDASGCHDAERRFTPECMKQPDRFAVVPFAGSGELAYRGGGVQTVNNARWEVCCGCGIPPREGLEGETDECGDSAQQRGLFEVAIDTAKALRADLRPRVDRFQQQKRLAEQYRSDFETVSTSCAGWDLSIDLLKALLGGSNAPQSAQTLVQLLEVLEKVMDEDPSVLLNVVESLPLPESLEFTFIGADDFTISALWDGVADVYEGALEVSQAGSIPQMKQRLEDCSDVPLVSHLVYDDAKLHLRHLEAAVHELPAIRQLTTRIEQADTEVYNRWVAYHSACLEEAQCRGTDPARCGPAPP